MLFILLLALSVGARASMFDEMDSEMFNEIDTAMFDEMESAMFDDMDSAMFSDETVMIDENELREEPVSDDERDYGAEEISEDSAYDEEEKDEWIEAPLSIVEDALLRVAPEAIRNCPTSKGRPCYNAPGFCINDDLAPEVEPACVSKDPELCSGVKCTCCILGSGESIPSDVEIIDNTTGTMNTTMPSNSTDGPTTDGPTTPRPEDCQNAWNTGCCSQSGGSCKRHCTATQFALSVNCKSPAGCPNKRCCKECRNNCACRSGPSPGRCVRDAWAYHNKAKWFRDNKTKCPDCSCQCFKKCKNAPLCDRYDGYCVYRRNSCRRNYVKVNCGCRDKKNCRCCVPIANYAAAAKRCGCNRL